MSYNEQEKEIKTIKERTITVRLSDADCERICKKAGTAGLSVGELFAQFVGDLVDGTYSNGSDERMYAAQWFNRCWFGSFPEPTLLKHLLDYNYDIDYFLTAIDEQAYSKEHPEEFPDDEKNENGRFWFDEDIEEYTEEFVKDHPDKNLDEEIEIIRKWQKEYERLTSRGEN